MNKLRTVVLLVLFTAAAAFEAFRLSSLTSLTNNDLWWHLASGLWIIHTHSLPHSGLFSHLSTSPWIAASWLWDFKLAITYRVFGLRAIPLLSMFFKAALAIVVFLLASRDLGRGFGSAGASAGGAASQKFWLTVLLSAAAQYVLAEFQPSPTCCSILFFG